MLVRLTLVAVLSLLLLDLPAGKASTELREGERELVAEFPSRFESRDPLVHLQTYYQDREAKGVLRGQRLSRRHHLLRLLLEDRPRLLHHGL